MKNFPHVRRTTRLNEKRVSPEEWFMSAFQLRTLPRWAGKDQILKMALP